MKLDEITKKSLSEVDNKELLSLHFRLNQLWGAMKSGNFRISKEFLMNKDFFILQELRKRGKDFPLTTELDKKVSDFFNFSGSEYASTGSSGCVTGIPIEPPKVLDKVKPFKITAGAVKLTGSVVNNGSSVNDLEIYLDLPDLETLKRVICFRVAKMFPEYAGRIHFLFRDIEQSVPFTSFIDVFDLSLVTNEKFPDTVRMTEDTTAFVEPRAGSEEIKKEAAESKEKNDIDLFHFFMTQKPTKPTKPSESQTIETFMRSFSDDDFKDGIFMSKKYDGVSHEIHVDKDNNKVVIFSEDGNDNSDRFATVKRAFLQLPIKNAIFVGELEYWKGKNHFPREKTTAWVNSKDNEDDSNVVINVFDMVFLNDRDLHSVPKHERYKLLNELTFPQSTDGIPETGTINKVPNYLEKSAHEVRNRLNTLRRLPGSEGSVAAKYNGIYHLDGSSHDDWMKFHNVAVLRCKILESIETKVPGTFNIRYGLDPGNLDADLSEGLVEGGKTFSTNLKFSKGDVAFIECETFNLEYDEKTKKWSFSLWAPRIIGKSDDTVITVMEAARKARDAMILQKKHRLADGTVQYATTDDEKLISFTTLFPSVIKMPENPGAILETFQPKFNDEPILLLSSASEPLCFGIAVFDQPTVVLPGKLFEIGQSFSFNRDEVVEKGKEDYAHFLCTPKNIIFFDRKMPVQGNLDSKLCGHFAPSMLSEDILTMYELFVDKVNAGIV